MIATGICHFPGLLAFESISKFGETPPLLVLEGCISHLSLQKYKKSEAPMLGLANLPQTLSQARGIDAKKQQHWGVHSDGGWEQWRLPMRFPGMVCVSSARQQKQCKHGCCAKQQRWSHWLGFWLGQNAASSGSPTFQQLCEQINILPISPFLPWSVPLLAI